MSRSKLAQSIMNRPKAKYHIGRVISTGNWGVEQQSNGM
jgi:hypothetical protein